MANQYYAGVDLALIGSWEVQVDSSTPESFSGTVDESDFSSTKVCHTDISGVVSTYIELAAAMQTALQAINANFTCTFNESTLAYTIANSVENFDLTFTTAAKQTLGFSANVTNVATTSSDVRPYYVIQAQQGGRMNYSDGYEPEAVASLAVSDSGNTVVGLARTSAPVYLDWRQQFETHAATQKHKATTAVPWAWQHFFEHCRTVHPFAVKDAYDNSVYQLRAEGSHFRPEPQTPDFTDQWHLTFAALLRGRL